MNSTRTENYALKSIEFISKYFTQLLFIPILLGGIIQVVRLYIISPQAIRFFSPSQAISDGIFYLTFVIIYIAGFLSLLLLSLPNGLLMISNSLRRQAEREKENTKEKVEITTNTNKERKHKLSHEAMPIWAHILIFLIVILFYYYFFFRRADFFLFNKHLILVGAISFALNFMLSINLMRFIYFNKEFYFLEHTKTFLSLNATLCIICTLLYSTYSINQNSFATNFRMLKDKYCCEKSGTVDIIYFNDKYIFIRRNCSSEEEEIIIDKMDSLFESI